ncbi:MAG TPA: dihydrolipoamide acetyltransferase family protein [Aeromicrobium sp.]|nr:dihydrolipoamide acetyltransferase family protein [Aeromicrobium sp.]
MPEYLLPDVGEGLTEADIVTWRVSVGDEVAINDIVVEIETAKSIVELPSPYAGIVTALFAAEGDTVQVGTPIIGIGEDSAVIDLSNPAASGGTSGESLVGRITEQRGPARRPRRGAASPPTEAAAAVQMQVAGAFAPGEPWVGDVVEQDAPAVPAVDARSGRAADAPGRPLAKPAVRALARELGVDLASIAGSGPDGVITIRDLLDATSGERREPIKGVRKMMATAMTQSAFTVPHVTEWLQVDATETVRFVAELKTRPEFAEIKVTPLVVLARAAVLALGRTPQINAVWDDVSQDVVFRDRVNLGIAAATPRGLIVPNIKDAHRLDLVTMAQALEHLTSTALAGKTQPEEYAHGTFTVTNVGVFGVDGGTPIINPGESAILCFGAIRKLPWVVTDAATGADGLAIRRVTTLAISFDHRHIDGAVASRFLTDVAKLVEHPTEIEG